MSRGLAAAISAAFSGQYLRPIIFVELQFSAGTEYLHDHIGTISWGGNDWTGTGELGRVEPIEEAEDGTPHGLQLGVSGLDGTFITEALANDYFGRTVIVYESALDTDGSLVETPEEVWRGKIDVMEGTLAGDLMVVSEHEDADFVRANGELMSDSQQQSDHPGDLGLEFVEQMADVRVVWGSGRSVQFGAAGGRLGDIVGRLRRGEISIGSLVGLG